MEKLNNKFIYPQTNDLIRSIEVLDMRGDTSIWGLYTGRSQKPHAIKSDRDLSYLLNQQLANSSTGLQLLFVVKQLWINEGNTTLFFDKQMNRLSNDVITTRKAHTLAISTTKMKCALDIFVKKEESYYALVRIDTLITDSREVDRTMENIINRVTGVISNKITGSISLGYHTNKKPFSIEAIATNYSSVFNLPVLENGTLQKGVYYNWEQFKNNQPSAVDFVIQKNDKEPPTLYLKDENGKELLTRDVFALSDGTKLYKVQEGYVFEMFCEKRSIYWMGLERRDVKNRSVPLLIPGPGLIGFGSESVGTKVKVLLTPYLMNLETGQEL